MKKETSTVFRRLFQIKANNDIDLDDLTLNDVPWPNNTSDKVSEKSQ